MKVELLYFEGCPHVEAARKGLKEVLSLHAPTTEVEEMVVASEEQ